MSCRKNRKLFVEALYSELTGDQEKKFEAHLESCPQCAEAYQTFLKTQEVLNQRTRIELEEAFWTGYTNRMVGIFEKESRKSKKSHRQWFPHLSPSRVWILGPAAAVSLMMHRC